MVACSPEAAGAAGIAVAAEEAEDCEDFDRDIVLQRQAGRQQTRTAGSFLPPSF
jgi:hypothetical protein